MSKQLLGAIKEMFTAQETFSETANDAPKAPLDCPECGCARMQSAVSKTGDEVRKTASCQNRECDWSMEWSR